MVPESRVDAKAFEQCLGRFDVASEAEERESKVSQRERPPVQLVLLVEKALSAVSLRAREIALSQREVAKIHEGEGEAHFAVFLEKARTAM